MGLRGTYLGYSDATRVIKGHRVWLPALDRIVIVKDIHFSELEHLDESAPPSHTPILMGDNQLLQTYHWLPDSDPPPNSDNEDDLPLSLPYFS